MKPPMLEQQTGVEVNPDQRKVINWKGLFLGTPLLWILLSIFTSFVLTVQVKMWLNGDFHYKIINTQNTVVKVLSAFRVVSQRIIVQEDISGHAVEIDVPFSCHIIEPLEGKSFTTKAVTYYRAYDKNMYLDFPEINKYICK